jgi:hypothetical protein
MSDCSCPRQGARSAKLKFSESLSPIRSHRKYEVWSGSVNGWMSRSVKSGSRCISELGRPTRKSAKQHGFCFPSCSRRSGRQRLRSNFFFYSLKVLRGEAGDGDAQTWPQVGSAPPAPLPPQRVTAPPPPTKAALRLVALIISAHISMLYKEGAIYIHIYILYLLCTHPPTPKRPHRLPHRHRMPTPTPRCTPGPKPATRHDPSLYAIIAWYTIPSKIP